MLEGRTPHFVSAAEITRNFGVWQDRAAQGPLMITHHGRPRCVLLTIDAYRALTETEAPHDDGAERDEIEHHLLAERIEGGFVALDRQLAIREATSLGALLLGRPATSLAGRPLADVAPAFAAPPAVAGLRRVLRSGEEARFDLPLGPVERRRLVVRAFPWPGGVALILRLADDRGDGERDAAEAAALAEARAAHGRTGVARLTVRATIGAAEPGFAALAGFAADRLIGVRIVDLLALSARVAAGAAIERVLSGGVAEAIDSRLLVNSGDELPVRLAFAGLAEGYGTGGAMLMMTPL